MDSVLRTALKHANNIGTAMIANTYVHDLELSPTASGATLTIFFRVQPHSLQQAIEKFHLILSPEEISKLSTAPPGPQSILNLTVDVNGKANKQRLRRWASCFEPFLKSIERYSQAVDVFVSYNPQIAALLWGSVRFVIIVCISVCV